MIDRAATAFVDALLVARYPQPLGKTQPWMRKVVAHDYGAAGNFWKCVYCGCDIGSADMLSAHAGMALWSVDHLVPSPAGGPDLLDNKVPACVACNARKGIDDWLLTGSVDPEPARDLVGIAVDQARLRAARLAALANSLNHLVRNPLLEGWTKLKVERVLAARWSFPRTTFFAACPPGEHGYVGLRQGMHTGIEVAAVLAGCEPIECAQPRGAQHRAWRVSRARWLDVVWQLIALNSLVLRLDLGSEFPDATPGDDADSARWAETYHSTSEVWYRRARIERGEWSPKRPYPRRPDGEPAPGRPTRPGGKLPRRPYGEGARAKRRARILADFAKRLAAQPVYHKPTAEEREQQAKVPYPEYKDWLCKVGMMRAAWELSHDGQPMPDDVWSKLDRTKPYKYRRWKRPAAS